MMPMDIPDPTPIKRNMSLARDAGDDNLMYLLMIEDFYLRWMGCCDDASCSELKYPVNLRNHGSC